MGRSTVAARVQGPATWIFSRPSYPCVVLLEHVEVLGEHRPGPSLVDAGRTAGEPPPRGLEVRPELGHEREGAAGHVGGRAAAGELGQVRQVGQLTEHGLQRLAERGRVVAGEGADARGGQPHASWRSRREARVIVAEPTTRVPS